MQVGILHWQNIKLHPYKNARSFYKAWFSLFCALFTIMIVQLHPHCKHQPHLTLFSVSILQPFVHSYKIAPKPYILRLYPSFLLVQHYNENTIEIHILTLFLRFRHFDYGKLTKSNSKMCVFFNPSEKTTKSTSKTKWQVMKGKER